MRALVYGWSGRGNSGDELMRDALVGMFSPLGLSLDFIGKLTLAQLTNYCDAVIFGGGSILDGEPSLAPDALAFMVAGNVPVFFLGVGEETEVHPIHRTLLSVASITAFRGRDISDLAYALPKPCYEGSRHGLLVIPNVEVVPTWSCPHWKHVAWERYKDEFSQALDHVIDEGHDVSWLLMCDNPSMKDAWPASDIMAHMKRRKVKRIVYDAANVDPFMVATQHRAIITQRYHGIILAETMGIPYVSVDHHDKMKRAEPHRGASLSYHGARKDELIGTITAALGSTLKPFVVDHAQFDDLAHRVINAIRDHKVRS